MNILPSYYKGWRPWWNRTQHLRDPAWWRVLLLSVPNRRLTKERLYTSLSLAADSEFRVLILYPGQANDPIVCDLQNLSLQAQLHEENWYEALSYVWGETQHQTPIFVNRCQIQITANLYNALLQLRSTLDKRRVWIDALCIYQESTTERNNQVRQMASIYKYAQRVIIWLGTCDDDATLSVIDLLQRRGSHIDDAFGDFADIGERKRSGAALVRILQRDWFCRIWTKQELAVSSDPQVMVGNALFEWDTFARWFVSLHSRRDIWSSRMTNNTIEQAEVDLVSSYVDMKDQYRKSEGMPLFHLLYRTRDAQASEPRDKIYALLGMSTSPRLDKFPPDYNLDVYTVCRRTVLSVIEAEGNLRPLVQWCERTRRLPSWVPDYTSSRSEFVAMPLTNPLKAPMYCASGQFFHHLKVRPGSHVEQLYITGLVFDIVDTVETQNWWDLGKESTRSQEGHIPSDDIRQSLDRSKPLWHTLIAGQDEQGAHPVDYFRTTGTHVEWSDYLLGHEERHRLPVHERDLLQHCVAMMKARCVFYTAAGFTGIGPRGLQPGAPIVEKGDVVAILYGGEVPYILRPSGTWYELIGECFVSGIMHGEFMDLYEKHRGEPGCPEEEEFELR